MGRTEKSKGTKVFALGGKIHNTGLVEIPMGTTLREVIEEIGGGIPGGKKFKAAQTGGPSGGCIPAEHFDIPIDYDNLISIGSMMGSGGLIVLDEDDCMVDIAKFFLEFTVEESCGKCTPCRIGTRRMLEILTKITKGQATMEDLDKLEDLCYYVKNNSLCGLGQTAPNPVLSTLRYFRSEYEAHIKDKHCPAGVCKSLLTYVIDRDKCRGLYAVRQDVPGGRHHRKPSKTRTSSIRTNVSSAAHVWKNATSAPSTRNKGGRRKWRILLSKSMAGTVTAPAGSTILEAAPAGAHRDSYLVFLKRNQRDRRLPHLCGKGQGSQGAWWPPASTPSTRAWRSGPTRPRFWSPERKRCSFCSPTTTASACPACAAPTASCRPLCRELGVDDEGFYDGSRTPSEIDASAAHMIRDNSKCILCRRCVAVCENVQGIGVIGPNHRGFSTAIGSAFGMGLGETSCVSCGQCIAVCPTGALQEKDFTGQVFDAIADPNKHVIVQTAPAVRAALGEEFGYPIGTNVEGKMVAALRALGFDKVFDTDFSADLTIMEEAHEFLDRVKNGGTLPLITSCSPGWIKYCEHYFPDMTENLSSCKSPAADVWCHRQILLRGESGHRSERHRLRQRHALHGQEVRDRPRQPGGQRRAGR